jgi:hypothetical protein
VRANLDLIAQQLYDELEKRIAEQLRAFIGMTAFEELCQEWVLRQARQGNLPFAVEQVGSHWDSQAQVDVAAINWREKALLLGEAKWQPDAVGRAVVRELIEEKTAEVRASLPDGGEGSVFSTPFSAGLVLRPRRSSWLRNIRRSLWIWSDLTGIWREVEGMARLYKLEGRVRFFGEKVCAGCVAG